MWKLILNLGKLEKLLKLPKQVDPIEVSESNSKVGGKIELEAY